MPNVHDSQPQIKTVQTFKRSDASSPWLSLALFTSFTNKDSVEVSRVSWSDF